MTELLPRLAGSALGGLFGAVAVVRTGKPLHPRGVVLDAVVRRTGMAEPWGARWLDEPGEDRGLARLSRSVGLPAPLPDVLGLALTVRGPAGTRHDLLLSGTGLGPVTRFLLRPARNATRVAYGSLFPYLAAKGAVLLAAVPVAPRAAPEPNDDAGAGAVAFRLVAAAPRGRWRPFGSIELAAPPEGVADRPVSFDPVLFPPPGLRTPPSLGRLRAPAYAAARGVRRAWLRSPEDATPAR